MCLRQVIYCITCTYCNKLYIGETGRLISEDRISSYCLYKISTKQAEKKNRNPPIPSKLKNFHLPLKNRWQKIKILVVVDVFLTLCFKVELTSWFYLSRRKDVQGFLFSTTNNLTMARFTDRLKFSIAYLSNRFRFTVVLQ